MLQFLSNAFNDPADPWYYVIGVLFLLLIFGALAFYVIWTGKKKNKADSEKTDKPENTDDAVAAKEETETDTASEPKEQDKE